MKIKVSRDSIDKPGIVEERISESGDEWKPLAEFPEGKLEIEVEVDIENVGWFEIRSIAVGAYYKRVIGNSIYEEAPEPPFIQASPVE